MKKELKLKVFSNFEDLNSSQSLRIRGGKDPLNNPDEVVTPQGDGRPRPK
jgi:hypothetical protein